MDSIHARLVRILKSSGAEDLDDYGSEVLAAWTRGYAAATANAIKAIEDDRLNMLAKAGRLADAADWTPSVDADYPR